MVEMVYGDEDLGILDRSRKTFLWRALQANAMTAVAAAGGEGGPFVQGLLGVPCSLAGDGATIGEVTTLTMRVPLRKQYGFEIRFSREAIHLGTSRIGASH